MGRGTEQGEGKNLESALREGNQDMSVQNINPSFESGGDEGEQELVQTHFPLSSVVL